MALVTVVKEDDKLYVGCDACISHNGRNAYCENNSRIAHIRDRKNTFFVALRVTPAFCYVKTLCGLFSTEEEKEPEINHKFITIHTLPKIYQALKDKWFLDKEKIENLPFSCLILHKNKAFAVDSDGYCAEIFESKTFGLNSNERIIRFNRTKGEDWKYRILKDFTTTAKSQEFYWQPFSLLDMQTGKIKYYSYDQALSYVKKYEKAKKEGK